MKIISKKLKMTVRIVVVLMLAVSFFSLDVSTIYAADPAIVVGTVSGAAGVTVSLPIQFNAGTQGVSALQFDLQLPSGITYSSVVAGTSATQASKEVQGNAVSTSLTRVVVYGLNQNAISSGQLLTVNLTIASGVSVGAKSIAISGIVCADPNAYQITASGQNGTVTIVTQTDSMPPSPPTGVLAR